MKKFKENNLIYAHNYICFFIMRLKQRPMLIMQDKSILGVFMKRYPPLIWNGIVVQY